MGDIFDSFEFNVILILVLICGLIALSILPAVAFHMNSIDTQNTSITGG